MKKVSVSSPSQNHSHPLPEEAHHALHSFLPRSFNFYDLGQVILQEGLVEKESLRGLEGICFRIDGDQPTFLLLIPPPALDQSLYSEMGNIISARIAGRMEKAQNQPRMISPPQFLSKNETELLISTLSDETPIIQYVHQNGDLSVSVPVLLMASPQLEVGHA